MDALQGVGFADSETGQGFKQKAPCHSAKPAELKEQQHNTGTLPLKSVDI